MKVSALTLLILHLNSLIDSGKYNKITIEDVHQAIEGRNVLRFLKTRCGKDIDLSIHLDSTAYGNFEEIYEADMSNTFAAYAGNENRKWGVQNSGLCLILAWTNEIVQTGKFHATDETLTWEA